MELLQFWVFLLLAAILMVSSKTVSCSHDFGVTSDYARIQFSSLSIPASIQAGQNLTGSVVLTNNGTADGDQVLEVYLTWLNASLPAPRNKLVWFDRVSVPAAHSTNLTFLVQASSMALWINNHWHIPAGYMGLYAGDQLPGVLNTGLSNILYQKFYIHT